MMSSVGLNCMFSYCFFCLLLLTLMLEVFVTLFNSSFCLVEIAVSSLTIAQLYCPGAQSRGLRVGKHMIPVHVCWDLTGVHVDSLAGT